MLLQLEMLLLSFPAHFCFVFVSFFSFVEDILHNNIQYCKIKDYNPKPHPQRGMARIAAPA